MRRLLSLGALSLFALSATATAQHSSTNPMPIEFGLDGTLNLGLGGNNNATVFQMPISRIRAGFFMSPAWSVEPTFSLDHQSQSGESASQLTLGVGALYHFSVVRSEKQIYVRPFFNFIDSRATVRVTPTTTTTVSENLTEFGGGVGVKVPWRDRLSWRLEANLSHNSKQYIDDADNRLGMLFGLSYFTR